MTRTSKCGLAATIAGFTVAFWLAVLVNFYPWQYFHENERLFTIIAPPAVFLKIMGATLAVRLFIALAVIAQNAVLYGIVGLFAGKIWSMIQPEAQSE